MLDRLAIHIQYRQRAVRRVDEVHWTKPVVPRSDKFGIFIGPAAFERDPVARQDLSMNQIAGNFADEHIAAKFLWIGPTAIDAHTAGAGPKASPDQLAARHVGPFQRPALSAKLAPRLRRTD